jgi:hypothetical protein
MAALHPVGAAASLAPGLNSGSGRALLDQVHMRPRRVAADQAKGLGKAHLVHSLLAHPSEERRQVGGGLGIA